MTNIMNAISLFFGKDMRRASPSETPREAAKPSLQLINIKTDRSTAVGTPSWLPVDGEQVGAAANHDETIPEETKDDTHYEHHYDPANSATASSPLVGKIVSGSFVRTMEKGVLFEIGQRRSAYIPGSLYYPALKKALKPLGLRCRDIIGRPLEFKVISVATDNRCILDFHAIPEEVLSEIRREATERKDNFIASLRSLREGDLRLVEITAMVDYGAFVRTELGIVGLIHRSEVGDGTLGLWPRSSYSQGDIILARVSTVDVEKMQVSFSLRNI